LAGTTEQTAAAQSQAAAVAQTVTTVDEAVRISNRAEEQAGAVAEAAERSVQTGRLGRKALQGAIETMAGLRDRTASVAEAILMLAERTQTIGQITTAIGEIADQTNLLALNASIEAARAGEHGTTFRVVANEVQALAQRCKAANSQVRQLLQDVPPAAEKAVLSIEMATKGVDGAMGVVNEAADAMNVLLNTVEQASRAATEIAGSARQQSAGMAQIHVAMKSVNQATDRALFTSQQAERAAHELSLRGVALEKLLAS
jgi:methyl-accepting chemotaxis protein